MTACDCGMFGPAHYEDCALVRSLGPGEAVLTYQRGGGFNMDWTEAEEQTGKARTFESGATRDTDEGKYDYEGFLHPLVIDRYAEYMHANRVQSDGELRDSDNWQKGIPKKQYMKSMFRHFMEVWRNHRQGRYDGDALCALLFNVMGYMYEHMQGR
jgi:hypothetical protein